jgi:GTPase SAR1 family protein
MQTTIYKRPALGQFANIGCLYNARTDSFLPENVLTEIPYEAVEITDLNRAETKIGYNDTYQEKFDKMAICPELMATVLAGAGSLQRSGGYLNEQLNSFPTAHRALHYSLHTVQEKLNLFSNIQTKINASQLTHPEVTHIVTEIIWGANCIVSATRRLIPDEDPNASQKSLEKAFEVFEKDEAKDMSKARHFTGQFQASDTNRDDHLEVRLYSDFPFSSDCKVQDLSVAKKHIINLPSYLVEANDGKGTPITFSFLPIGFVSMIFGIPPTVTVGQPNPECLKKLVALLDSLSAAERSLNEYYDRLKRNKFCIPSNHFIEVGNQIRYAGQGKSDLLMEYSRLVKPVREGTVDSGDIWRLLENFDQSDSSPKHLSSLVNKESEKIDFVDVAMSRGAEYIGYNEETVDSFLRKKEYGTVYIMFFNAQSMRSKVEWEGNCNLLFSLLQKGHCSVAVVDCDASGRQIDGASIVHYDNGDLLTEDLYEQEKELATKSFIQYDDRYVELTEDVPAQRQAVILACPGPHCDPMIKHKWVCYFCQCPVEYSTLDKYFYCSCGRVRFDKTMFKCCNPGHGTELCSYDRRDLYRDLETMPPPNELNILILGETGVGKSTFINAFINYLTYDSLDEALTTPNLNWVIPSSFAIQLRDPNNNSFKHRKVLVGNDSDEHNSLKGQSATQKATAYAIYIQDQLVRLIDTPGMGDTKGPEQDRKNMSDVLSVLRSYDDIHGIIILLKANASRLNFMFRFVIQELLAHLHRSAGRNMVFAFTNTRGTNYTPGDSYVPLSNLLSEFSGVLQPLSQSNVYCFDSESFRYLAAKKMAGLELGHIEDYRRSWLHSSEESHRLRAHFQNIQPHPVKNTVSLNATRYLIENLIAPMRQVSKTILGSIAESEKQRIDLEVTAATGEELKAKLKITKKVLETHTHDRPITACNHVACIQNVEKEGGQGGQVKIRKSLCKYCLKYVHKLVAKKRFFKSIGHKPCSLKEITPYTTGAAGLSGCTAFHNNGGKCKVCLHSWEDHEHILVTYTEKTETTDDPEVLTALQKTNNETRAKMVMLKALEKQISEFREEHRKIQEAAARFTVYMQKNSITVYNDATLEYLHHLIKEENVKVQMGGNNIRLEALKKEREQYQAYVETVEDARKRGVPGAVPDEQGISRIVKDLYAMTHYGKELQKTANIVGSAYAAAFRETRYHIHPKQYWMRTPGRRSQASRANQHGQARHSRGRPFSSLLDIGSSKSGNATGFLDGRTEKGSFADRSSKQRKSFADDKSLQELYAQNSPENSHSSQQPPVRGLLPFDDEPNSHGDSNGSRRSSKFIKRIKELGVEKTDEPSSKTEGEKSSNVLLPIDEDPPPYETSQNQSSQSHQLNGPDSGTARPRRNRKSMKDTLKKIFGK